MQLRLFAYIFLYLFVFRPFYAQTGSADEKISKVDSIISVIRSEEDDLILSLDLFDEALKIAEDEQYIEGQFKLYFYGAKIYRKIGHFEKALENYSRSKKIIQKLKDKSWEAKVINNESVVFYYMGNLQKSIEILKQAIPIYNSINDEQNEAILYGNLAYNFFELEQFDSSIVYNKKAMSIFDSINIHNVYLFGTKLNLAKSYNRNNEQVEALNLFKELINNKTVFNDPGYVVELYSWRARSLASIQEFNKADLSLAEAEKYLEKTNDPFIKSSFWQAKAEVFASEGKNHNALDYLKKSIELEDSVRTSSNSLLLEQFKKRLEFEKDLATQKSIEFLEQKNRTNYLTIIAALFIGTIIVAFSFFTIRKKSEKLEAEKNLEYEILFKKFESFLEQTNEAVRLATGNGKVIIWNRASEILTGIEKSVAIGNNYVDMVKRIISDEDIAAYQKNAKKIMELIDQGKTFPGKDEIIKIKNGAGENIFIKNRIFPIYVENETYIAGTSVDVTEEKKYEQGLLEAKELAENSDKSKTEFLAQMSHEIRTPINTILNFCALLEMEYSDDLESEYQEVFQSINRSGERIIKLMDTLLNISEIESGTVELSKTKFNIYDKVIDPLVQDLSRQAEKKNLKLIVHNEVDNAIVFGDEYTITQAISNLIDTSIRFSEEGEILLEIKKENDVVILILSDPGKGYSDEFIEEVFNDQEDKKGISAKNFSVKNLGVSLVKKYCDLNEIELKITNKEKAGSIYTIKFL